MWVRWDAGWYRAIAQEGYYYSTAEQSSVVYFPLYPLLMRGLAAAGVNVFIAGILTTVACGTSAVVLFRKWAQGLADGATARLAFWVLILWPFAFFLYGAIYSDALFLLLVVAAFFALERDRVWVATLCGALATLTRPIAPAVVAGLLVRQLELRRRAGAPWRPRDFAPVLAGSGAAAYCTYLGVRFGNPLAFLSAQAGWAQTPGTAWLHKFSLTASTLGSSHPEDALIPLFNLSVTLALVAASFALPRKWGWGYAVYSWIALAMPLLASRDFIGLGRYSIAAFPCFLVWGVWLGPHPVARRGWFVASAALLALMVSKFAMGRYVS